MKTALVTGVSRRVGRGHAAAHELAAQGYHVIVAARHRGAAEVLAARLRVEGFSASPLRLDLRDTNTFAVIAAELQLRFGHLDALVHSVEHPGADELTEVLSPLLVAAPAEDALPSPA